MREEGFPGGSVVKNPPAKAGDKGSVSDPEDPICRGATKPMWHSYQVCALEPGNCTTEPTCPRASTTTREATAMRSLATSM